MHVDLNFKLATNFRGFYVLMKDMIHKQIFDSLMTVTVMKEENISPFNANGDY
jgi:hypothetical protein